LLHRLTEGIGPGKLEKINTVSEGHWYRPEPNFIWMSVLKYDWTKQTP